MKKLLLMKSILLLFALIAGSSSAWATNETITITCSDVSSTTSYSTDEKTFTNSGIEFGYKNVMINNSNGTPNGWAKHQVMQCKANGEIYNTEAISGLKSIRVYLVVNTSAFTVYSGTSKAPETNSVSRPTTATGTQSVTYTGYASKKEVPNQSTTANYYDFDFSGNATAPTYFRIKVGSNTIYIHKIEITYTSSALPSAGLEFAVPSFKVSKDLNEFPTPTLTNPHDVTVEYSSSNEDVALVDENTGYVALCGEAGTTTITATFAGNSTYAAGTATYTITTYDPAANDGSEGKPYSVAEALTNIAALADNGTIQSVYVKGKVHEVVSFNDNYKSITYYIEDLADNTKTLYVYGGKGVGNADFSAETDLTVGDEVMIFGTLQKYVKNSTTTPEFTSNNYIAQYKHGTEPEVKSLQVNAAAYRTYVASANLVVPTGVKAFIATSSSADELTLTSVPKIKEGTPVILNATEGYYSFEITDETVTYPNANLLKISDGTITNGVYVLAKKGDDVKFYKWAGGALSPGKVYVEAPSSSAREYLDFVFDNEATAIETVKTNKVDGQYYNLAGQRVANPTKGLYIVNGNKVIIK